MRNLGRRVHGLRLNVFQRIAAGYGFILLILLGTGLLTFARAYQSGNQFHDFSSQEIASFSTLNDLTSEIYLEETAITRYTNSPLAGSARDEFLNTYFQVKPAVHEDLRQLRVLSADNTQLALPLGDLARAIAAREAQAESNFALVRAGKPVDDVESSHYSLMDAIQGAVDEVQGSIKADVDLDIATADKTTEGWLVLTGLFWLLGAGLTVMAGLWSAESISRPLALLTRGAERIAGGELIDLPRLGRADEIGTLSGAIIRMVGSLRKITEKEREVVAEHKLVQEELRRSNAELEQFAYIASHDLQEPLRMVGSYTSLLKRRYAGKLDADADEFMTFAMEGVTRMRSLINDLLTYSRVGKEDRASLPTDSRAALDRALANLQVAIAERGAAVIIGQLPTVMASPPQLTQVFQNLIGNGLKFCKEAQPEIRVGAERKGGEWVFSVGDNGIGIRPEDRDRIFLIFQRLHKREEYEGTGIGLAICKKIVERHGGRIWVDSEPGKGATFRFTLHTPNELEAVA